MPDAAALFEVASAQAGLFTGQQAEETGYSKQLVAHHVRAGRFARAHRGIYRLVYFPLTDGEAFVVAWLWSDQTGVLSHQTALSLYELSDVLPAKLHLTLPLAWRRRRLRVPAGVVTHFADVAAEERGWHGPVPITSPGRTLRDCALASLSPDLLRQAAQQALRRGLVSRHELGAVETALHPFGGVEA